MRLLAQDWECLSLYRNTEVRHYLYISLSDIISFTIIRIASTSQQYTLSAHLILRSYLGAFFAFVCLCWRDPRFAALNVDISALQVAHSEGDASHRMSAIPPLLSISRLSSISGSPRAPNAVMVDCTLGVK